MKISVTRRGLLAAALLATAASLSLGQANAADTIKIGVITDETGRAAFYAKPVTQGVLLAAKAKTATAETAGNEVDAWGVQFTAHFCGSRFRRRLY